MNVFTPDPLPYPEPWNTTLPVGGAMPVTVEIREGKVWHVHLPWRVAEFATAAGLDWYHTDFNAYVRTLARIALARRMT